jgi:triacylglycerol lipase
VTDDLLPPCRNREFFNSSNKPSFTFSADEFDWGNAVWLAEASLAAYDDLDKVEDCFQLTGCRSFKAFSGGSTQCYVAYYGEFALVAFRGTQVPVFGQPLDDKGIVADVLTDANIELVSVGNGRFVHAGINRALDEVWDGPEDTLKPYLTRLREESGGNFKIWFTGHSLGGALATLAADRYGDAQGVYTFGSPRVGNDRFRDQYGARIFRFVNDADIVTNVPVIGSRDRVILVVYAHVGEPRYFDSQGNVSDNIDLIEQAKEQFLRQFHHFFTLIGRMRPGFLDSIPPNALLDHAPVFYADFVQANYLKSVMQ